MTKPDKLYGFDPWTIEQCDNWLRNGRKLTHPYTQMEEVVSQLADTMRENKALMLDIESYINTEVCTY